MNYLGSIDNPKSLINREYINDIVAEEYDSTKQYSVGDYVIYNGDYWVCKTAITIAETWDSQHWRKTSVGKEIANVKQDLINYNAYDIMFGQTLHNNKTESGITFSWDSDNKKCNVNGTASQYVTLGLFVNTTGFPIGVEPGKTYYLHIQAETTDSVHVGVQIGQYKSGIPSYSYFRTRNEIFELNIDSDTTGLTIGFYVSSGATVNNEKISMQLLNTKTNEELFNDILEVESLFEFVDIRRGTLPSNTDANDITQDGLWWIHSINTYYNLPAGMTKGILISRKAIDTNTIRLQIAYSNNNNKMYFRYHYSEGWGRWLDNLEGTIRKNLNMYDKTTDTLGYFISTSGIITANEYFEYSAPIPVKPNTNYFVTSTASGEGSSTLRIHSYQSDDTWIKSEAYDSKGTGESGEQLCQFCPDNNAAYIRISVRKTNTDTFMGKGKVNQPNVVYNNSDYVAPIHGFALQGRKLSILGASISTFEGYIPEGYSVYYPHTTTNANPVTNVHDTYWQKVLDSTGMELLVDNASAGSFVTTGHGSDAMAACGDRCISLDDGNTMPDVIIIQIGGNDFTRSTPLGTYDGTQDFPVATNTFREAYAIMLNKITTKYVNALVLCGTIPFSRGGTYVTSTFPPKNKYQGEEYPGGILLEEYNKAIRELASLFGCKVVEFSKCGMTFNNISTYMQDYIGGYGQHPNKYGHSMMANEVLNTLGQSFASVFVNH